MDSSSPGSDSEAILPKKDRTEKLRKKRERMKKHGKGLAKIYKDAVEKRKGKLS
jgi:hypothetical protein